jgi:ABC-2 type transport system ATP-binding protein
MSDVLAVNAIDLTKTYGPVTAVDAITVQVAQGEVYGVLGPNGAGKTTFLRMLFGLIRPDSGTLEVFGRSWPRDVDATLEGVAGFIESPKFYPALTGRRNLQLLAGLDGASAASRIDEVLDVVELADRQRDKVRGYSFGMRQRLGVAAALLRNPRLLVLDERPTGWTRPASATCAPWSSASPAVATVLLSSHDMAEMEQICDDVTIMRTGSVVHHGSIAALRERAPAQAHRIATTHDARTETLAHARGLQVTRTDEALAVRGSQDSIDALIADIIGAGIALRALSMQETPLEALFFMLTESAPNAPTTDLDTLAATGAKR